MGRHSIGAPGASIAPPDGPIDPGVPGAPDAPSTPEAPIPEPGSPEITPSEPPPFAPDEVSDGAAIPPDSTWRAAGEPVL